ncbi:class C beta-lactamase [Pseudomonas sp. FEN]|uniref:class C beta-lactamase n=1 Tax=Pseudomonas sp. FEN TaxID=2767468 RepID=UPI001749792F|nr:class C beta-lactamase [Pseudomonas sp. FEN]
MFKNQRAKLEVLVTSLLLIGASHSFAADQTQDNIETIVDAAISPLMQEQNIPGMAVAVLVNGKPYHFYYGVASRTSRQPVTDDTLFEIGSVSKTFTATLAGYAQAQGKLVPSERVSHYLPELRGSAFDRISVLQLGTYSAGGLPLQFPEAFDAQDKMLDYFKQWKPTYAAGSHRQYSNPSLGLFGYVAAKSLGAPFDELMEKTLFPKLGLKHSYIHVPQSQMSHYAQGYTQDDKPVRVGPGALDAEAYGIKTTGADLLRYVEANLRPEALETPWHKAVDLTQMGYYQVGGTTQGLGWEFYPYPVKLDQLLTGNASEMALEAHKVSPFNPARPPQKNALFNKTGSTRGFGAYVLYVPAKQVGIVMLANKYYPNPVRVKAAYQILHALEGLE